MSHGVLHGVKHGLVHGAKHGGSAVLGGRNIIFIAGQSNAEGQGSWEDLTGGRGAILSVPYPGVPLLEWNGNNSPWSIVYDFGPVALQPRPDPDPADNMGIELSLGRGLDSVSHRFSISKFSVGGTSLAFHWDPAGNFPFGSPTDNLFSQMLARMTLTEGRLGGRISTFVWIQGENDATDAGQAAAYGTNLTNFMNLVRAQFPNVAFVIVQLNAANAGAFKADVRTGEAAAVAAVSNSYLLDVDAYPQTLHYSADQLDAIGTFSYPYVADMAQVPLQPIAGFTYVVAAGSVTTFTDTSSDPNPITGGITAWSWNFGDGVGTSTLQNPVYDYAADGNYSVSLTVTNTRGQQTTYITTAAIVSPSWTIDATSGISVPSSSAEWTAFISAHPSLSAWSNPTSLYLVQEASGNLADTIGSNTLVPAGAGHLYQQTVSGWTRKAIKNTDGTSSQRWACTTVPTLASNSYLFVGLWLPPAATPALTRRTGEFGVGTQCIYQVTTTPRYRQTIAGVTADGTSNPTGSAVRPVAWLVDRTGTRAFFYNDQEKKAGTYSASLTGAQIVIGASSGTVPDQGHLWVCTWFGATAERSDADIKALFVALGYSIPWS